jgi:tetratricopeptide (TPR) repeat protein
VAYFYEWDWDGAERCFKRALECSPNSAFAHYRYWALLLATGRVHEASREIRRAEALDPLSPIIVTGRGVQHHMLREFSTAIAHYDRALALEGSRLAAQLCLWRSHELVGDYSAAASALAKALELQGYPRVPPDLYRVTGEEDYVRVTKLVADQICAESGQRPLSEDSVAWLYLSSGDHARALSLLEEAFSKRAAAVVWTAMAPEWDPLAGEPRFCELVKVLGLTRRPPPGRSSRCS